MKHPVRLIVLVLLLALWLGYELTRAVVPPAILTDRAWWQVCGWLTLLGFLAIMGVVVALGGFHKRWVKTFTLRDRAARLLLVVLGLGLMSTSVISTVDELLFAHAHASALDFAASVLLVLVFLSLMAGYYVSSFRQSFFTSAFSLFLLSLFCNSHGWTGVNLNFIQIVDQLFASYQLSLSFAAHPFIRPTVEGSTLSIWPVWPALELAITVLMSQLQAVFLPMHIIALLFSLSVLVSGRGAVILRVVCGAQVILSIVYLALMLSLAIGVPHALAAYSLSLPVISLLVFFHPLGILAVAWVSLEVRLFPQSSTSS